jgi:endonuclease/exonuclease/phosphatase family metal-dependent hydrolase
MKKLLLIYVSVLSIVLGCDKPKRANGAYDQPLGGGGKLITVLVWNIQNGMWADQGNDYDNFVKWVKEYKPDVCIWCEARSNYQTGSKQSMPKDKAYLPDNWGELAARYGHPYWAKGGHRDNFPQVITSRYPVHTVEKIIGNAADSVVTHGCGHHQIVINGKILNIVTLHLWAHKYAFGVSGTAAQKESEANNGGDHHRLKEIAYICDHTIAKSKDPVNERWLMAGDFNAQSSLDNDTYNYSLNDTRFMVHEYILENTPYVDVIKEMHQDEFKTTTSARSRIDFVYCSPAMMKNASNADVLQDSWTGTIVKDEATGFKYPSDHRPIYLRINVK